MMFSFACLWSSLTHCFALSSDDFQNGQQCSSHLILCFKSAYGLRDIIYYDGAVGIPVVHWRQGLVSFLASGIPYLELHGRGIIKRNGLC